MSKDGGNYVAVNRTTSNGENLGLSRKGEGALELENTDDVQFLRREL